MAAAKINDTVVKALRVSQLETLDNFKKYLDTKGVVDMELIKGFIDDFKATLEGKDKLYFFSKSASVRPGKGKNEYVTDHEEYKDLPSDFRCVLSNFHVAPFIFDGFTYNTIEHVFQAKKIELVDPNAAYRFTVESGDPIGLGDGAMAQKHRRLVTLPKESLGKWDDIKWDIMKAAAKAKYAQNPAAAQVLIDTKNAELWHIVSRKKPIRFKHLEDIRSELKCDIVI